MLEHNSYFEGKVQSVGFERNGRKATAGVIDAGEFHFNTAAARLPRRNDVRGAGEERVRREGVGAVRVPLRVPLGGPSPWTSTRCSRAIPPGGRRRRRPGRGSRSRVRRTRRTRSGARSAGGARATRRRAARGTT